MRQRNSNRTDRLHHFAKPPSRISCWNLVQMGDKSTQPLGMKRKKTFPLFFKSLPRYCK